MACILQLCAYADDFGKPKTTFLICAFWYVEALACVGRVDDAVQRV
jgi:GH15 family glucan-1,4-alpha-glucosidase